MIIKIYIFCNAGMSTSLLASKMESYALENGVLVSVKAHSVMYIEECIAEEKPELILLGPQIRHLADSINMKLERYNIPILVIDEQDYGNLDARATLKKSLNRLAKKENQ